MMQSSTSLHCYSTLLPSHHSLFFPLRLRFSSTASPSQLSFKPLRSYLHALRPLRSTDLHTGLATQEIVETAKSGAGFVEVGYISNVHGLQGEICVKPSTEFPELRFSKPGRRWLRQTVSGKDTIQEVELVEGRGHPGQKRWILRFGGIDAVEQARQLVGSTLLVREEDRPELEQGEFYTRDLVGMRVILKVMLHPSADVLEGAERLMPEETDLSGPLVWVPFVEAIVPDIDMTRRKMWITPPKGLLELNIRTDERSKKERRKLEWKERKKFQRRLIEAKKKLCEMEQKHVFDGLRYGEKSQRSLLADQIVGVNSKLLQQALQNIEMPSKRLSISELISAAKNKLTTSYLKLSKECFTPCVGEENLAANLQEKGVHLLSKDKVAIVLVVNDIEEERGRGDSPDVVGSKRTEDATFSVLQKSLSDDKKFLKMEDRASVPLLLVCPVQEIQSVKRLFSNNDYFGFDTDKVWFLEEEKLPIVSIPVEEQSKHKILMKSPWEILQSPIGSGGVISLLLSHKFREILSEMGVEYIEVCSVSQNYGLGDAPLLGFVNSCGAEIGIQIFEAMEISDESFDMIFSITFMKKLMQHMDKLQFSPILKQNSHVKMIDKEWIDVVPSSPNSYQFHCSIYSALSTCPLDNICLMEVTE
ncbi:uncharacterized protein LOC110605268 isoform X3 [Manihot esculenta]|uniref:uncharacterized protein LOC110605268 isoform X3 n=1 Tax=Manihot esculenta TaxID=3983 RepID=UPI000B5D3467|nr:uncharacterized protein LOC110605268 isoform X3 [Manihot esculenta]